jgi:Uma2 family endonuclease
MSSARSYQPNYRYADYLQWEGDWELWFGRPVAMSPSPFGPHERSISKLVAQIDRSISERGCDCCVYAGLDWVVSDDMVVRPDLMVVCGDQPEKHLFQTPSLVVEVLSESMATKDKGPKKELYAEQGVKDYLILDTIDHSVVWYSANLKGQYQDMSDTIPSDGLFNVPIHEGCILNIDRNAIFAVPKSK